VACITKDPNNQETRKQLLNKYFKLSG